MHIDSQTDSQTDRRTDGHQQESVAVAININIEIAIDSRNGREIPHDDASGLPAVAFLLDYNDRNNSKNYRNDHVASGVMPIFPGMEPFSYTVEIKIPNVTEIPVESSCRSILPVVGVGIVGILVVFFINNSNDERNKDNDH